MCLGVFGILRENAHVAARINVASMQPALINIAPRCENGTRRILTKFILLLSDGDMESAKLNLKKS